MPGFGSNRTCWSFAQRYAGQSCMRCSASIAAAAAVLIACAGSVLHRLSAQAQSARPCVCRRWLCQLPACFWLRHCFPCAVFTRLLQALPSQPANVWSQLPEAGDAKGMCTCCLTLCLQQTLRVDAVHQFCWAAKSCRLHVTCFRQAICQ